MSITQLCEEIKEICQNEEKTYKGYKNTLVGHFSLLIDQAPDIETEELDQLLLTHQLLCQIQNRKAAFIEKKLMDSLFIDLPVRISFRDKERSEEVEILREEYADGERKALVLSAKLMKYGKQLLLQKDDKSKRVKNRITGALRVLEELNNLYLLPDVKDIFEREIRDTDPDVQFFALVGLEGCYAAKGADPIPVPS